MAAEMDIAARRAVRLRHIVQGKIAATDAPGIVYTAILGAGVFVCLHDPVSRIGGVAHFLFPDGAEYGTSETRFAAPALTALVARLSELGAPPARLGAKLYGGAKMHDGCRDLGQRNIGFALRFLKQKGIAVLAQGTGGDTVRRVRFCPTTGESEDILLNAGLPHDALAVFGTA